MTSLISRQYAVGEITYISGIVQDFDRFKRTLGRFAPVTTANPLSFWSQIDIPNPLYLFKLERDRRTDPQNPTHRSPTIGKLLQPTAHLPVSHHFTPFIVTYTKVPSYLRTFVVRRELGECQCLSLRTDIRLNGISKRIVYGDQQKHFVNFVIMSTDPRWYKYEGIITLINKKLPSYYKQK